jgi:hypothetical protein
MRKIVPLALVAFLGAALNAQSFVLSDIQVIPVVAHTSGLGSPPTYWVSDVTVHNPTDATITIGLAFLPENTANPLPASFPVTRQLAAHESVLFENVLGTTFGYTGNIKGILAVFANQDFFPSNPHDTVILVTSRTYNTGAAAGTYGQTIAPANELQNYTTAPALITGVRHDDHYRSNMGIANLSANSITVHWTVRTADAHVVKSGAKTIPGFSMGQWTFASLGIAKQSGVLTVEMTLDAGDVSADPCSEDIPPSFVGYVSKVDGNPDGTGDGEHIYAVPSAYPSCFCENTFS